MSNVLIFVEQASGEVKKASLSAITFGQQLCAKSGGELFFVVMGSGANAAAEQVKIRLHSSHSSAWLTSDHLALSRPTPGSRQGGAEAGKPSSRMGAKRTDGAGFDAWLALGVLRFKTKFTRMQQ